VDPILSREAMLRIIREAKQLSGRGFNVSLSGGEPTIYKPLYEILELTQQLGVNFGFTTNGLSLTKRNVERILSYDPFNINVSLESVDPKINEDLRRPMPDGTRRILDGIENVLAEKKRIGARVSIIVKATIMEQNYRTLPDLVRYFGKHSEVQVNFQPFVGVKNNPHWGQGFESPESCFSGNLRFAARELLGNRQRGAVRGVRALRGKSPRQDTRWRWPFGREQYARLDLGGEKRNCDIGLRSMFIFPNGDVYFCDFLGRPIGSVYQQSLSDIYYGKTANGQRAGMVYCDIDCQQTCKRPTPLLVKARTFLRMG